jgi:Zn-dependent M28 family amino/carboxypeptidase
MPDTVVKKVLLRIEDNGRLEANVSANVTLAWDNELELWEARSAEARGHGETQNLALVAWLSEQLGRDS